jgi:hypothetical protein
MGIHMHAIIDDFAWVVIALSALAVLFIISSAFVLLDEGLRIVIRRLRNRSSRQQPVAVTAAVAATLQGPLKKSSIVPEPSNRLRRVSDFRADLNIWRGLWLKAHEVKWGAYLKLHLGHRKP